MKKLQFLTGAAAVLFTFNTAHAQIFLLGGPNNVNDGNFSDGASTFTDYDAGYPEYQTIYTTGATSAGGTGTATWSVTSNYGNNGFAGFARFGHADDGS